MQYVILVVDHRKQRLNQCVERWKAFHHQNIAECYGYALDCGLLPALVMRHYPEGNVVDYVTRENSSFEDRLRLVINALPCVSNPLTNFKLMLRSWISRRDSSTFIPRKRP